MTTTCPAPECGAEVLEATDPLGGRVLLSPKPRPAGKYAAHEDEDGTWHARLLTPARPLEAGEARHAGHTCAKLAPVRKAEAAKAAVARNRRGTYAPRDRRPFRGAVPGGRILPPGGVR